MWSHLCAVLQNSWSELREHGRANWMAAARLKEELQVGSSPFCFTKSEG